MNRETFAQELREKLAAHGITQTELADRMGIDRTAMSRWLSTTRKTLVRPSLKSIQDAEYALSALIAKRLKSRSVSI